MPRQPDRYAIVWTPSDVPADAGVFVFQRMPMNFPGSLTLLANRLRESQTWNIDAAGAKTLYGAREIVKDGQPSGDDMFVCGYFVVKDTVANLMQRTRSIDLTKVRAAIPTLPPEASAELEAHTTFTFAPLFDIPASILLVWAKKADGTPKLPVDFVMDVIFAYNKWANDMAAEGVLLDAGRLNVRHDSSHVVVSPANEVQLLAGPKSGGRITSLISYSSEGPDLASAVVEASFTPNTHVELRTANKACTCNGMVVATYMLDPRNTIFV